MDADAPVPPPAVPTGPVSGGGTGGSDHAEPTGEPPGVALVDALELLRRRLDQADLPLEAPGAVEARSLRSGARDQLDDYLLPRLRSAAAPLVAVVGGSTGAGKSTLVNSLLGDRVSASGVLRPTTRWPVLVHHPVDGPWFSTDRVLPGLARLTATHGPAAAGGSPEPPPHPARRGAGLTLVASAAVPPGLALLDAPDVDSVVEENRTLARQLLAAADLWLFVTTAARYADAVPWDLLADAAARRTALAVVLDRVDPGEETAVTTHLRTMLDEHDLAGTPVLLVPEADLVDGLLPEHAVATVADWLTALAADPAARGDVLTRTRDGLVADLVTRAGRVAAAADAQRDADRRLRAAVDHAYGVAADDVARATSDGQLLRGEVLARWQEVVGTGELMRAVEERVGRWRDRLTAVVRGRAADPPALAEVIGRSLDAIVVDAAERAAAQADAAWRADPAGRPLLDGLVLSRASVGTATRVADEVRGWQDDVLALVRDEGAGRRTQARALSLGVNGLGAALMLVVLGSTGGLTGAEVGIAGGTAVLAQRLLEAVFGDDAVRRLTSTASTRLHERVVGLLDAEAARFTVRLDALGTADASGDPLREAAARVTAAPAPALAAAPAAPATGPAGRLRGTGHAVAPDQQPPGSDSARPVPRHRWWQPRRPRGSREEGRP